MTKHCSMVVAAANDWDSRFPLDHYCVQEIRFWENNMCELNCDKSGFVIYSDASQSGCAAHMTLNDEQILH